VERAKNNNEHPRVKGPVHMPTKVLRITTRKTTCGEGVEDFLFYLIIIKYDLILLFLSFS
jgi:ribosomal protein S10